MWADGEAMDTTQSKNFPRNQSSFFRNKHADLCTDRACVWYRVMSSDAVRRPTSDEEDDWPSVFSLAASISLW